MKAEIGRITRDYDTGNKIIELVTSEPDLGFLDALRVVPCDVTIKKWHPRRSLTANAYCWVLCQKLAEVLDTSKDEVYETLIQKYGYFHTNEDDSPVTITVSAKVDMARIEGHFRFCRESSDGKWKSYILMRGSSEYDSKEMAHFIDGIIWECKEQNIETLPPDELERMIDEWRKHYDNKMD